ncbi:hypothetical protein M514_21553 [Trichuris suis]|uniref:Uncharacterized protein n=1 Tax=Trichuris suis TaxID=68888 RepID=A0A085N9X0_9BILA|nr:hypothetical protein M514_21553 [Trichuris suis]
MKGNRKKKELFIPIVRKRRTQAIGAFGTQLVPSSAIGHDGTSWVLKASTAHVLLFLTTGINRSFFL